MKSRRKLHFMDLFILKAEESKCFRNKEEDLFYVRSDY